MKGEFSEKLRLRVTISSLVKFYVCLERGAGVGDLKALVTRVMLEKYGIELPDFSIRSDDGYEVLEYFTLSDVLRDDQSITIEQTGIFTMRSNAGVIKSSNQLKNIHKNLEDVNPIKISNIDVGAPAKKKESSTRVANEALKKKIDGIKKENVVATPQVSKENPKNILSPSVTAAIERKPEGKLALEKKADEIRFDSNFKGFAVWKKDLNEQTNNTNVHPLESFRPIKKKKQEEMIELI